MRALAVLAMSLALVSAAQERPGWKLVWADEFDKGTEPDPAVWNYEHGFVRNHENQFYTNKRSENVRIENGMLVIEGRKEHFQNDLLKGDDARFLWFKENRLKTEERPWNMAEFAEYTSGSINTRHKKFWQYGRIEVRAKLPKGKGVWPAIWTVGSGAPYPLAGEIDIMEYVGFQPSVVHGTIHGKGKNGRPYCSNHGSVHIPNIEDRMAVYAIEWTHDRIWFFVDDQMYFTVDLNEFDAVGRPFDYPQYLKLNLALGGSWGGQIDDSIFPQTFEIDYVRVYQFE